MVQKSAFLRNNADKFLLKTEKFPKINPVETRSNKRLGKCEPAPKNVLPEEASTRIASDHLPPVADFRLK
ncbi:MAG: hypothetical protein H0U50_14415 [Pyrinomonadaceae bacterium]|nr:hypothetical protein [Pyrinomonadaceae bacterium]